MEQEIKQVIKDKYTAVVKNNDSCCSTDCCTASENTFKESYENVDGYEPDADLSLGCGIPTSAINIKSGDTVLDLGSGAGNDVFVARQMTGPTGKVLGLDMTEAMIEQANKNKAKLGFDNVAFILGEIEDIPLEGDQIDVVISNCVMNLVPNKEKGYSEVYRVLKPGGQFSMSDIVTVGTLPEEISKAAALYAGCVAGALLKETYLGIIKNIGFQNITIHKERIIELPDDFLIEYISKDAIQAFRDSGASIYSITVTADKPR